MRRTIRAVSNRFRWRTAACGLLVLLAPAFLAPHAMAQSSAGEDPHGTQGIDFRAPKAGSQAQPPSPGDLERIKQRFAEQDRARLQRDLQKLSALSQKLQTAMQSSTSAVISPDVHALAGKIEKLARRIREELAGT
jgi:hypothetical protein